MDRRRVVITGIGIVSPLGLGVDKTWKRLIDGESGISKIDSIDVSDMPCKIAGNIPYGSKKDGLLNLDDWLEPKEQRRLDRFISLGLVAANEAITDSGLDLNNKSMLKEIGVLVGSGIGGLNTISETALLLEKYGPRKISPFFIPSSLINLVSGQISIKYGFSGPNHSVVTACSSGSHAIGDSARIIKNGDCNVMIAGGTEAAICRLGIAGFCASRALATSFNEDPKISSRPWDEKRDGFVMGEGSGIIVLEELNHALDRNAKIYAEIIGYGMSGDAYHITAPEPEGDGAFRSMQNAMKNANVSVDKIDYINAHGTSTPKGDIIEIKAIKKLMGDYRGFNMSSTKSSIGHLLGAAGAVEAIFSILSIRNSIVPPTINLFNPSPETQGINLTPLYNVKRNVDIALSNSFGFGGTNASLVFSKYLT